MIRPRLLICTIMRNARPHVETWYEGIARLWEVLVNAGWDIECSVYENDSTDGTDQWLNGGVLSSLPPFKWHIKTDTLGTTQYGSVWNVDRIRNLAAARNKCLEQVGGLERFQKIVYIEPDVTYDPAWAAELIRARHPAQAGIEPHIYSGWSLRSDSHPKESVFLYDTCATRATRDDKCWDPQENGGKWRGESLVRTDLGGVDNNCLHRVWSTFNCFCVYDARPFIKGVRWGHVNSRINPSGIYIDDGDHGSGWLDADTSIMCESFRDLGYSNVLLNTNCLIRHS